MLAAVGGTPSGDAVSSLNFGFLAVAATRPFPVAARPFPYVTGRSRKVFVGLAAVWIFPEREKPF